MDNFYQLLVEIKSQPRLFLGRRPTLEKLHAFLCGYEVRMAQTFPVLPSSCLEGFDRYIEKIYSLNTTHSWSMLIDFFSESDEEAFDRFFTHIEEYKLLPSTEKEKLLDDFSFFIPSSTPTKNSDVVIRLSGQEEPKPNCNPYEHLKEIKKRPGLYLGATSLTRLYAYLCGYCYPNRQEASRFQTDFSGFQAYIASRYKLTDDHTWAEILCFFSVSEEEAFHLFYKEWEAFLAN